MHKKNAQNYYKYYPLKTICVCILKHIKEWHFIPKISKNIFVHFPYCLSSLNSQGPLLTLREAMTVRGETYLH